MEEDYPNKYSESIESPFYDDDVPKSRTRGEIIYDELIHTPLAGASITALDRGRCTLLFYCTLYACMLAATYAICHFAGWLYERVLYPESTSPAYIVTLEGYFAILGFSTAVLHIKLLQLLVQYFCR